MDNPIQTTTFKQLNEALERKDLELFESGIKCCMLTHSELLSLQQGALKAGCKISILVAIQKKLDLLPALRNNSRSDNPKPQKQGSHPNNMRNTGNNRKIEIIAYKSETLRYCIFDHTPLHFDNKIQVDTNLTLPGYVCSSCKAIYVHYNKLPPKGKKSKFGKRVKNKISVRDISKVIAKIPPKKKKAAKIPIQTYPINQDKNHLASPFTSKKTIYVSSKLPQVCVCNSVSFECTKYFSLANSTAIFSGKYCSLCDKWFITTETFNSLSPNAQSMIERKAVTWIKKPNTQINKNKAIPKAPPPPPRSLFWWEEENRTRAVAPLSEYPSLQGKGKQILQVSYGIDFGASTTKVIIRTKLGDNKPSWRALVFGAHFACEEISDNTLAQSQIYISDTGRIGLGKEGVSGWKVKQYFKAVLINAKNPKQDLDEVYYAIFYIATILKTIQEHLKKAYPPAMYSKIDLKITMGMPIRGEVGPLATVFTNILHISDELKENREILLSDGIDFASWKALCKASHSQQKLPKPYLSVSPEIYSEVVGLFTSSYGPTHRALVIDVGSSTLDLAFVYTEPPILPFLYIPIAEVASLGVEVVASSLISNNPTVFSTLHQAKEYLITYPQKKVNDKALRELVQELFRSCIPKIKRVETEVFGHALVQPNIPVYFYGGGRDAKWYKGKIKNILDSVQTEITFDLPFTQLEAIPRVPSKLLHRFQVALGLSNNGKEEKPLRALPKDYNPFWDEPPPTGPNLDDPPPKGRKRIVDLEELQKNLYGN